MRSGDATDPGTSSLAGAALPLVFALATAGAAAGATDFVSADLATATFAFALGVLAAALRALCRSADGVAVGAAFTGDFCAALAGCLGVFFAMGRSR